MNYSICVIDDQIPAGAESTINEKGLLNRSNLKLLLEKAKWEEPEVKNLIESLAKNKDVELSAFIHPEYFIKYLEENHSRPDIVILDWNTGPGDPKQKLLDVLKRVFCILAVYTGKSHEGSVKSVFADPELADYSNRLDLVFKDAGSDVKLVEEVERKYHDNFSFQIGSELRGKTLQAVETVLIDLGKHTPRDIVWLFGDEDHETKARSLELFDLVAILVEKIRNNLLSTDFKTVLSPVKNEGHPDIKADAVARLWGYRMYYKPIDDIVRTGDIVFKKGGNNKTAYLILSSNCHLQAFWAKNAGFLTMVPLHKIALDNDDWQRIWATANRRDFKPSSIANTKTWEHTAFLPGLSSSKSTTDTYILCCQEILTHEIALKAGMKAATQLTYEHLHEFEGSQRSGVSEPFLTALIQHVLTHISGNGAPDYPAELQSRIKNTVDETKKEEKSK